MVARAELALRLGSILVTTATLAAVGACSLVPPPPARPDGPTDGGCCVDGDGGAELADGGGELDGGEASDAGPSLDAGVHGGEDAGGTSPDAGPADADVTLVDGVLRFKPTVAAQTDGCAACPDDDLDGLNDVFEAQLIELARPLIRLAADDEMLSDGSVLAMVARVFPVDGAELIRVFIMVGYTRDYGSCGFTAHAGDSERVALEVANDGDGWFRLRRFYTAAHENTPSDRSLLVPEAELSETLRFAEDAESVPRVVVFSSRNKHGSYANEVLCDDAFILPCFAETCAPLDTVEGALLLPPAVNAGELDAPFIDDLSEIGFPEDDAWAEQDFCGGLRMNGQIDEGCSAPVREKLLVDPFEEN